MGHFYIVFVCAHTEERKKKGNEEVDGGGVNNGCKENILEGAGVWYSQGYQIECLDCHLLV